MAEIKVKIKIANLRLFFNAIEMKNNYSWGSMFMALLGYQFTRYSNFNNFFLRELEGM